jgi:hypothetical protein
MTTYLVQFDRKGKTVSDWFADGDLVDMGFDGWRLPPT